MSQIRAMAEARTPRPMDEQSFQGLYGKLNRPIYNFFANRGFSRDDSRELVQETFLAAFDSRSRFRGESTPETWLFSIATNIWRTTVRDRRRSKRDAQVISLESMIEGERPQAVEGILRDAKEENRPLEKYLADERVRLLREALDDLPEQMRRCVVLRLNQDLKYREIAEVMQVSINTVRSQLFEAREKLRSQLEDHFTEFAL